MYSVVDNQLNRLTDSAVLVFPTGASALPTIEKVDLLIVCIDEVFFEVVCIEELCLKLVLVTT
jgi:hypothetical protein